MKKTTIEGRCWIISDAQDIIIQNIDTDMIFHNAHLAITDVSEMGKYAFGNLDGWLDFPEKAQPGDIVLAGANFGAGSSRQQAVDCFAALGIQAIIAVSFGAIYYRNAVNSGFPVLIAKNLNNAKINSGDKIRIKFETGDMFNLSKNEKVGDAKPFSKIQHEIYLAGSLFNVNPGN